MNSCQIPLLQWVHLCRDAQTDWDWTSSIDRTSCTTGSSVVDWCFRVQTLLHAHNWELLWPYFWTGILWPSDTDQCLLRELCSALCIVNDFWIWDILSFECHKLWGVKMCILYLFFLPLLRDNAFCTLFAVYKRISEIWRVVLSS